MAEVIISNAVITGAQICFSRGSFLDAWIFVRHEYGEQGFGGYVLGGNPFEDYPASRHGQQPNLAAEFIGAVLKVAGRDDWDNLRSSIIRVQLTEELGGTIRAIGHAVDDLWWNPEERFSELIRGVRAHGE